MEQRIEDERGVDGLGGHAGHAADRGVRAAGAVEELEVGVDGLARSREADGDAALHAIEVERAPELLAAHDIAPVAPGLGGTNTSGSTRVTCTCAA